MNRLGNAVRAAVAAAVFVLPVAAAVGLATAPAALPAPVPATVPVMDTTTQAGDPCCTGTPWGEIGQPPVVGDV